MRMKYLLYIFKHKDYQKLVNCMFQWPIYEDASALNITISTTNIDSKWILSKI